MNNDINELRDLLDRLQGFNDEILTLVTHLKLTRAEIFDWVAALWKHELMHELYAFEDQVSNCIKRLDLIKNKAEKEQEKAEKEQEIEDEEWERQNEL